MIFMWKRDEIHWVIETNVHIYVNNQNTKNSMHTNLNIRRNTSGCMFKKITIQPAKRCAYNKEEKKGIGKSPIKGEIIEFKCMRDEKCTILREIIENNTIKEKRKGISDGLHQGFTKTLDT